jgi:LacI family transcriptional regulator
MISAARSTKRTGESPQVSKRQKRVLLAMGWYDSRLHEGIAKYAVEHNWHLCPDTTKEKVIPWGWEGDGILAWLGAGDDLAEFVVQSRKPTVDFSFRRPQLHFPRVLADHEGAARLVANHFLSRGFRHFMFYSERENWAFEEDGKAFVQLIQQAGYNCPWICWERAAVFTKGRQEWKRKRAWLADELKRTPKPLALFAATDDHAMEAVEACERVGLAVPEQVSIVGMDNSLHAVEAMRTPISSVDTNFEQQGYRGAELLDELMKGRPAPKEPIRVPVAGLITRKSSDFIAVTHPGIARSLRFMLDNFHKPISVDDMAQAASMSRRGFHHAFLQHVRRTPGHELQHMRIERAKKLLAGSNEKIGTIGELCGYQSANGFWLAFTTATGQSPQEYRNRNS